MYTLFYSIHIPSKFNEFTEFKKILKRENSIQQLDLFVLSALWLFTS